MIRLVLGVDVLVRARELAVRSELGVMQPDAVRLRVAVDVGGSCRVAFVGILHDRHAALRADDVLHEEGRLAHHRAPARLVPADRPVVERDLQLAVVVHPGLISSVSRAPMADTRTGLAPVIWHITST